MTAKRVPQKQKTAKRTTKPDAVSALAQKLEALAERAGGEPDPEPDPAPIPIPSHVGYRLSTILAEIQKLNFASDEEADRFVLAALTCRSEGASDKLVELQGTLHRLSATADVAARAVEAIGDDWRASLSTATVLDHLSREASDAVDTVINTIVSLSGVDLPKGEVAP